MEFDILDSLEYLGYAGSLKTDEEIKAAIELGHKSIEFTQMVEWLSKELQALNNMESCIHALTDLEDASSFLLEVSSFLREMNCPYKSLLNGPISQRLIDTQSHRTLVDYLCTELQAARVFYRKKQAINNMEVQLICENCGEISIDDIEGFSSSTALSLKKALRALNIRIDSNCEDPETYLFEMENKIRKILDSKSAAIPPAIISEKLSEQQWESLRALYEEFLNEYTVRRRLLLTRLEVTMQSFKWGDANKGKEAKLTDAYLPKRKPLKDQPSVKLSDVIAARENLLVIEKTSSANLVRNTKSSVNKVLIPAVPDRGGRPKEQRPPVEMPNWKKRSQDGGWGGGGGGGQRGGRGNWRGQNKKFHGDRGGHQYDDNKGKYSKGRKRRH